jgi:predicted phage baseplate assembly protein
VHGLERQQLYVAGTTTNLKPGERLLLVGKQSDDSAPQTMTVSIERVEAEPVLDRTRIEFVADVSSPEPIFTPLMPQLAKITLAPLSLTGVLVDSVVRAETWRERDLSAFLSIQGWSGRNVVRYVNRKPPPPLPPADAGVFAFGVRSGPFGHNAPRWDTLPLNQRFPEHNEEEDVPYPDPWDTGDGPAITRPSQDDAATYMTAHGVDFFAERTLTEVIPGGWVLLENQDQTTPGRVSATRDVSLADFALSAKATGIAVTDLPQGHQVSNFTLRSTTIHAASRPLQLAELPIDDPLAAGSKSLQLESMVLGLQVGQPLALSGERDDLPGVIDREIVILADILHGGGFTTLFFAEGLTFPYVRKTVSLQANVVLSTHGETIGEVLGGGDSTRANQRFTLKRPPLTHVSAATPSGAESTLEVRVNGVRWDQAPSLFGLGPADERYVVRLEDDGETRVIFGDGAMGARVPTGLENVTGIYRSGIGQPGMVGADTLTLLQTRPLGIRGVTNPLPASGAEDPEDRDNARNNAPLTVLTLDRIVSLQDFEDFARAFAGIGKAQAVALWKGHTQLIHVTIASASAPATANGEGAGPSLATNVVDASDPLFTNLVAAIEASRDPGELVTVASYQPLFFNVKAKILVDARLVREVVTAAVETALEDAFSFRRRAFGQPVTVAEVVTVIQGVNGVEAVDLDQLYRYQDNEVPPAPTAQVIPDPPLLTAERARWDDATQEMKLAELLLINPVGITLEEMKA